MTQYNVSIIIPVYNTECFLERCLQSVLSQDATDYEVILVDDGSTDNSGDICNRYAGENPNVSVYHTPNTGVSGARNYGLSKACGEYIMFVDSDDEIPQNSISSMLQYKVDLVVGGYLRSILDEKIYYLPRQLRLYSEAEKIVFMDNLSDFTLFDAACHKLFKKNIIDAHHLQFNSSLNYGEDKLFVHTFLLYATTFATTTDIVYHQIRRMGSLSSDIGSDKHIGQLLTFLPLYVPVVNKLRRQYDSPFIERYYHVDVICRYVFRILSIYRAKNCSTLTYKNTRIISRLINADNDTTIPNVGRYKSNCIKISREIGPVGLFAFISLFSFYDRKIRCYLK